MAGDLKRAKFKNNPIMFTNTEICTFPHIDVNDIAYNV